MTAWLEYCALWRLAFRGEWPATRFAARVFLLLVHAIFIFAATAVALCVKVRG